MVTPILRPQDWIKVSHIHVVKKGEKVKKKSSYQNATICEITKQASSDSMDFKLLKS